MLIAATAPKTKLSAALVALQADLPHIGKTSTADAGTYTYDYADLTAISKQLLPLLAKHGLAFMTRPTLTDADRFVLVYSLIHESGEREDGEYPLPTQGSPQAIGSAISYGRRYCLCAVTGVAPGGSDDDGAAAEAHARTQPRPDPAAEDLNLAKSEVRVAWEEHRGAWDIAAAGNDFAAWAQGELMADAPAAKLREYATHLAEDPEQLTLDGKEGQPE